MGEVVALIGSCFVLVAAVGALRLPDVLSRLHALGKATTLGVVLVLSGTALTMSEPDDWTTLVLALLLQLTTTPVSATLIARSVYRAARTGAEG